MDKRETAESAVYQLGDAVITVRRFFSEDRTKAELLRELIENRRRRAAAEREEGG